MKILHKYLNGNVSVILYDDGTKIYKYEGEFNPKYPMSVDLKVTNYCDMGCKWCHEKSTTIGKHADFESLINICSQFPEGIELAIGGGNPLSYPELDTFLRTLKRLKLVPNLTVNAKHLPSFYNILNHYIEEELIYGLGISIDNFVSVDGLISLINNPKNVVFHVINGIETIDILDKICNSRIANPKILILGYKKFGRGKKYFSQSVQDNMNVWYDNIHKYINKLHLSFDNLAINQLNIKRFLNKKEWEQIYMGDDGEATMYIDAVKAEYAVSSRSTERFPLDDFIVNAFKKIKCIREMKDKISE